jgi:tetratricopeptide (TPR) repeat protein
LARQKFEQVTREYVDEKEAWYGLGEALYHGRGDFVKAREAFGRAVALDPSFTIASRHLVDIERIEGKLGAARGELDRLIRADRENPTWQGMRVALEVYSGDQAAAQSYFADALKQLPTPAAKREVCKSVAEAYFSRKPPDYARARQVALKALSFDTGKKDPSLYATLGWIARMQGKSAEAEKWFLRGLEFAPNDVGLINGLATLYQFQGRFKDVVKSARSAIARNPQGARDWYSRWATAAAALGDSAEIAKAIPAALVLYRDRYSLRRFDVGLAWAFSGSAQYQKAEEYSRKAIEAVPECEDPSVYNTLGWSLLRQKKRSDAEAVFQRGIALSPQNGGLQSGLLQTYTEAGRRREALELSKRMCRELPASLVSSGYWNWIQTAAVLEDRAEIDSALALASRSLGAPDRGELLVGAGWAYFGQLWDLAKAIEYFRAALPILSARGDTRASNGLGWSLYNFRRYPDAEGWFRKSLASNEEDASALSGLTAVLVDQKRYKEAEVVAQQYAKLVPAGISRVVEVQIRAGNFARADWLLERAIADLPSAGARRRLLAQVASAYFDRSEIDRARALDRRAAALGPPGDAPELERLVHGLLLQREGNFAAAESMFMSYQAYASQDAMSSYYIGVVKLLRGDSAGAEREMRAQIARKPAHSRYYRLLGTILAQERRFSDALPFAERAVAMDSSRASYSVLAWTLVSGEIDVPRGEALARRALGVPADYNARMMTHPFTPSLEQTLGVAAMKRGDNRPAVRYLEEAARLRSDRPSIQENLNDARRRLAEAPSTHEARPR